MAARLGRRRILGLALAALGARSPASAAAAPVMVFAAASLADILPAIVNAAAGLPPVRFSFAASSTLARQIENGAPASLFVSADEAWVDHLQQRGKVVATSRRVLAGNRLVVVKANGASSLDESTAALDAALAGERVATGDPAHVPVGRYAEAALRQLGLWERVAPRLVRAENVRSALAFVERGEAAAGIVYATDAAVAPRLHIVARFPRASHLAITYPVVQVAGAAADAALVQAAFFTPQARALLAQAGFELPPA